MGPTGNKRELRRLLQNYPFTFTSNHTRFEDKSPSVVFLSERSAFSTGAYEKYISGISRKAHCELQIRIHSMSTLLERFDFVRLFEQSNSIVAQLYPKLARA